MDIDCNDGNPKRASATSALRAELEANGFARGRFNLGALRCGEGLLCLALGSGALLPERLTLAVAVARDLGLDVVGRDGDALILRPTL